MTGHRRNCALLLFSLVMLLTSCKALEEQIDTAAEELGIDTQERFSTLHHDPPPGMTWLECPDGKSEGRMRTIGSAGGPIRLSSGHVLDVRPRAVTERTDFVFVEPRSAHVVVYAKAVGTSRFAGEGLRLVVSWSNRPGCDPGPNAVVARIVPGGTAEALPVTSRGPEFIEVRLDSLSTFAIAT